MYDSTHVHVYDSCSGKDVVMTLWFVFLSGPEQAAERDSAEEDIRVLEAC